MSDSEKDESPSRDDEAPASSGGGGDDGDVGISDDQLPEDLQPTDDNPLAKPPSEDDDEEGGISLGPDGPQ